MIVLDTDALTFLAANHPGIKGRLAQVAESVAITVVTRIEVLQGRFSFLLKAADGEELQRAQAVLERADRFLASFQILPVTQAAADVFDTLRENKKLKKIGRADLLIACIVLAEKARLVTRNLKHFSLVPGLTAENWID